MSDYFELPADAKRTQPPKGPNIGPFSKIPSKFFSSGTAASLGPSASLMYLALCEHANRHGGTTFKASDKALASETGLSPRTLSNSRKKFDSRKLLTCAREKGQSFVYTLHPLELQWRKLEDRLRQKQKPRGQRTVRGSVVRQGGKSPSCGEDEKGAANVATPPATVGQEFIAAPLQSNLQDTSAKIADPYRFSNKDDIKRCSDGALALEDSGRDLGGSEMDSASNEGTLFPYGYNSPFAPSVEDGKW